LGDPNNIGNRPDKPVTDVDERTREVMTAALHLASAGDLASLGVHPDLTHLTASLPDLPDAYVQQLDTYPLDPFAHGPTAPWALVSFVNAVRSHARTLRGERPVSQVSLLGVGSEDHEGVRSTGFGAAGRSDPARELAIRRGLAMAESALLRAQPYGFMRAMEEVSQCFHHGQPSPSLFTEDLERVDELSKGLTLSAAAREQLADALQTVRTLLEAAQRAG
jgi:hypothetical protein